MGNSAERSLAVLLPYGFSAAERYPTAWFLDGYFGNGISMISDPGPLEQSFCERIMTLQKEGIMPRALSVFPDCSTRWGGSQYLDSSVNGPFLSHLVDELVPFVDSVFPTWTEANQRIITGHSSGGYGALMVALLRPGIFGSVIASAADSAFELSMRPEFNIAAITIKKAGSIKQFLTQFFAQNQPSKSSKNDFMTLMTLCMASCYSPNPKSSDLIELPFLLDSLEIRDDIWNQWLAWDPLNIMMKNAKNLKSLRHLHLDVGSEDEFCAQFGHRAMAQILFNAEIPHVSTEFNGGHYGTSARYRFRFEQLTAAWSKSKT